MKEANPSVTPDHAIRDWSVARPRLRRDVAFTFHQRNGKPVYVLEDLVNRRYFQFGLPEYQFLRSLDGDVTVAEAVARSASGLGARAISSDYALTLVRWLVDHDLLASESADQNRRRIEHGEETRTKPPGAWTRHLFFLKVPLGNPDPLLGALQPWLGWLFSRFFFPLWLGIITFGGYEVAAHWRRFSESTGQAILPGNWVLLAMVFLVLKLIHELGHGVATRRFGGTVPEWGVQMIAFVTPLTYVDASSSWRFPQRSHRMTVAAAGMYIELLVAAIAAIAWARTSPGPVNTLAHHIVFAASVVTLLFNANPLMRFDGYYLLSDALDMPNLAQKGQVMLRWLGLRYLFGMGDLPLPTQAGNDRLGVVAAYGILGAIWKVLIWVGIMALIAGLARGAGLVLVAVALVAMVFGAVHGLVRLMKEGSGGLRLSPWRVLSRITVLAVILTSVGYLVQFRSFSRAAVVVTWPDKAVVRARVPGFVRTIHREGGERIEAGTVIAELENREIEMERRRLEVDIARSELRARRFLESRQLGAHQAEEENLNALKERLAAVAADANSLVVRAPIDGTLHFKRPDLLAGRFLNSGEALFTVFPKRPPEVLISAEEEAVEALQRESNPTLKVRLLGRSETIRAELERVESSATVAVPHLALASVSGGPLTVLQRSEADSEREKGLARTNLAGSEELAHFAGLAVDEQATENLELAEARFTAYASVDEAAPLTDPLREGEYGFVRVRAAESTRLGRWIYDLISEWVRRRWDQARQA